MISFLFCLGQNLQKMAFFSSEGIKSPKRSDHDGKAQKQALHQICKGSHEQEIPPTNTKLDVA